MNSTFTDVKKSALLVIDVQESFRVRSYWSDKHLAKFINHTNALIKQCVEADILIVRVFHTDGDALSTNPFAMESGLIKPLKELAGFNAALTIYKHKHSALVDTGLKGWLHANGVQKLIICGVRTEQCCETTARHASDEGWAVDFATRATLTFDMTSPDGQLLTAEQIMQRTETVLAGRFATII
jgi:nicotinamidase-related amidase